MSRCKKILEVQLGRTCGHRCAKIYLVDNEPEVRVLSSTLRKSATTLSARSIFEQVDISLPTPTSKILLLGTAVLVDL